MTFEAQGDANALNVFLNTAMPDAASVPGVVGVIDTLTARAWAVHDNAAGGLCVDAGRAEDLAGTAAIVRGTALDLLSWLRNGEGTVHIDGDVDAAEALRGAYAD